MDVSSRLFTRAHFTRVAVIIFVASHIRAATRTGR